MVVVGVSVAFLLILSVVQACVSDTCSRECPTFWTRFGDNCYRFFGTPKTRQEAENHCQEFFTRYDQGHLASVSNQEENEFLQILWSSSLVPGDVGLDKIRVWIGLNDIEQEGSFVWIDGRSADFTQWHSGRGGQPDNSGNEDCVVFVKWDDVDGWNDQPCNQSWPHMCQISSV